MRQIDKENNNFQNILINNNNLMYKMYQSFVNSNNNNANNFKHIQHRNTIDASYLTNNSKNSFINNVNKINNNLITNNLDTNSITNNNYANPNPNQNSKLTQTQI